VHRRKCLDLHHRFRLMQSDGQASGKKTATREEPDEGRAKRKEERGKRFNLEPTAP
jgi:hypothetical protein